MWKKIKAKIMALPWVTRNRWLFEIIYRAVAIVSYVTAFTWINKRWEDIQVVLVNPAYVNYTFQLLGAIFIVFLGVGLFSFRLRFREQYGWIEVIFGGVSGFFSLGRLLAVPSVSDMVAVVACIYLVVRGCDNIYQGFVEKLEKKRPS